MSDAVTEEAPNYNPEEGSGFPGMLYAFMAFVNWIMMFPKYGYWVTEALETKYFQELVEALASRDLNTVTRIKNALENLVNGLYWPIPAALLVGSLFNSMITPWVMWYYIWNGTNPEMGAFMGHCSWFFWIWLLFAWL